VGIGTSSPSTKLQISGSSGTNIYGRWSNGTQELYSGISSGNNIIFGSLSNDAVQFWANSAERLRIQANGSIYSGTNNYTAAATAGYWASGVDTYNVGWFENSTAMVFRSGTGANERMRLDSSGNLLVGTTSSSISSVPGVKIRPSQDGAISCVDTASTSASTSYVMYSTGASAYRFYVTWAGTIFATSTTISAISDQRLKENVSDLDTGLDAIMALKPRKFDWKEGKGKNIKGDRGFIAQEFEQVFPDLIDEWKDPAPEGEEPYKAVRADLIPVLVKAVQELKADLDAAKAEIAELKAKA
jgi:hypothetical protein